MPLGGIMSAIIGGVAAAGVGAGISAAVSSDPAEIPDYSKTTKAGVESSLAILPGQRAVEAAARMGTVAKYPTGRFVNTYANKRFAVSPNGDEVELQDGQTPPKGWLLSERRVVTGQEPEMATADFTGNGDIQNQQRYAEDMAAANLELSKKYGKDFVTQARKMSEEADPEGWAARALLDKEIARMGLEADQASKGRPLADEMERQLLDEQMRGNRLTTATTEELNAAMRDRAAMGDAPQIDTAASIEALPGDARQTARQQKELGWLTSGATPEDVEYRRSQQQMANMGSFINGQTPVAQFSQLSGAQTGASPMMTTNPLPSQGSVANQNAFTSATLSNANQQNVNAQNTANGWLAGLSGIMNLGGGVAGAYLSSTKGKTA